jgi:hypothetical protein
MTSRTRTTTITFSHPFRLSAVDETLPAGSYVLETDEELIQGLSFPAYRRLATYLHLAGRPGSNELGRMVTVDPAELDAALALDAARQQARPAGSAS